MSQNGFHRTLLQIRWATCLVLTAIALIGFAAAQAPPIPASSQFDITGFMQTATLDGAGSGALKGGHLTVNGHLVTVPSNLIVILPANALTWAELFSKAPAPYGPSQTGLAMYDTPTPLTTFEVHVIGNIVNGQYIAGMVEVAQQSLNGGAGYINFIDYATGELRVGGVMGSNTTGTRVRINDPLGRYGRANSPDVRFTVDPDNPTIMAGTGYPMCIPRTRVDQGADDPICPQLNRPTIIDPVTNQVVTAMSFTTPPVADIATSPIVYPDSRLQAPFKLGDYVIFSGLLVADCATCQGGGTIAGPLTPTTTTFISADTIGNNTAIYTSAGSNPAYTMIEVGIIGTGGLTVVGAGEAAIRSRWEGMTTDFSRSINLYGMDWDSSGNQTDRYFGTIGVDPGPAGGVGAVQGRWRFRPPCLPFGSIPAKPDKQCVMNQAGTFLPPPREVRAIIAGLEPTQVSAAPVLVANGLIFGQYHAPIDEYIFPENIPGTPIVENNFNAIPFLSCGGYSSSGIDFNPAGTPDPQSAPGPSTLAPGPLSPWPSNIPPNTTACAGFVTPPAITSATASPTAVFSGSSATVTLSAIATGTGPLTFAWTQTGGTSVVLTGGSTATATFVAPVVAANETLTFSVSATNSAGSASAPVSVSVVVDTPIVNHIPALTVNSGQLATMTATGTDPGGLPLTFTWTQTNSPANVNPQVAFNPNPFTGTTISFTPTLPIGAPGVTYNFTVVATNSAGIQSAPEFTTVTVNPTADVVTITNAEFRTGKVRLDLSVTSSVISPSVTLSLDSYLANDGTIVTGPFPLVNTGGGIYTLTLVGSKPPICRSVNGPLVAPCTFNPPPLTVRSNLGGVASSNLLRIRQ